MGTEVPSSPPKFSHVVQLFALCRLKRRRALRHVDSTKPSGLVSASPAMVRTLDLARRVAQVDSTVLVTGESGSERSACAIHSRRIGTYRWLCRAQIDALNVRANVVSRRRVAAASGDAMPSLAGPPTGPRPSTHKVRARDQSPSDCLSRRDRAEAP